MADKYLPKHLHGLNDDDDDDDDDSQCSSSSDDNVTAFEMTNLSTIKKRPQLINEKKSQENWVSFYIFFE